MTGLATLALTAALPLRLLSAQGTGVVHGTVSDSSGTPVADADVWIPGTVLLARTDRSGRYQLARIAAGRTAIEARAIGYARTTAHVEVLAGDSARADFVLARAPLLLEPVFVTVTSGGRRQLADHTVTSVAVVERADLEKRAVYTMDDALDRTAGVQFLNGQINIRGSTGYVQGINSRVLLVVDGVPANQGDRGGINWDLLPVDDIERLEIMKGAGSSLYGSAALGGVVHVTTREIPRGRHVRVRASGGAYADPPHAVWRFRGETGLHGGAYVTGSYGTDTWGALVTGGARHSDGYREQDERNHWQMAAKGAWRPYPHAPTLVQLSGSWAVDRYDVPLLWCLRSQCDDRGQAFQPFKINTSGLGDRTDSRKGYLTATVTRTPSARAQWQARGSWLRTRFTDYRDVVEFSVANRLGTEVSAELHPDSNRAVTVGVEGARSDLWSNIFSGQTTGGTGRHSQGEYAAYGESEQLLGRVRLTVGARMDFLVVDDGGLTAVMSPRVGAVIPSGAGTWRASVGRGFRAASMAERFVHTFAFGLEVIPNPALDPETAWSGELGNAARLSRRARLDAAVFWTEARDLIEPRQVPGTAKIQLQNVTGARLAGLDVTLAASPLTDRLTTSAAYTYLYARQLAQENTPERPLGFRPRHLLTLSADYTWGPASLGADFRYSSRVERIELEGLVDERRVAPRVVDLRASYVRHPFTARLLVANALNYIYNVVPQTLAPVRTLSVVLTWTY